MRASSGAQPHDGGQRRIPMMPVLMGLMLALSFLASEATFPARLCDFRAFYCSGRMVIAGRDPYREHPLHECEQRLPTQIATDIPPDLTIPAPYPGYVLAIFALVGRLPFNLAAGLWTLCSFAALCLAIAQIAKSTQVGRFPTAVILGLPAATIAIPLGQPTIFVLLGIAMCATALRSKRPAQAAAATLITFIDPHVGVALALSLWIAVPQTRLVLAAGIVALAGFDLLAFGPAREYEYLFAVLPAHALVNIPEFSQFSISNLLYSVGVAPHAALTVGNVWYALALLVGSIVGLRLRARLGTAAVVFVPVAFAVFGGVHTHLQQLDLALPAFLLVLSASVATLRRALVVLTFIAAVPWLICAELPSQYLAVAALAFAFAQLMDCGRLRLRLGLTTLLMLTAIGVAIVIANTPPQTLHFLSSVKAAGDDNPLAQVAWGRYVASISTPVQAWFVLAKVPTLFAFCAILVVLLRAAFIPVRAQGPQRLTPVDSL